MPHDIGSIRPIAALVAMAASTALPPCLQHVEPDLRAASGWLVATMPLRRHASPSGPALNGRRRVPLGGERV